MAHVSVLLNEVIENLDIHAGDIVLDGTVGSGGHSLEICKIIGESGRFIGIDNDNNALLRTKDKLASSACNTSFVKDNFRNLDKILEELGIEKIDKALFDLGLSSNQLEDSKRGFSFLKDEPLLMTFSDSPKEEDLTAYEIVNDWDEENIADIIFGYGEEKYSRRIASGIIKARSLNKIETTYQLVEIIKESVPSFYSHQRRRTHFATKTFQALRTAVNDEIRSAKEGIEKAMEHLNKDGRVAVITFHSIEDRMVKLLFREKQKEGNFNIITKKPIVPSFVEVKKNPRARSAKLRVCEKI